MDIHSTIRNILRDKGVIDNGISDVITECIESTIGSVIMEQLSLAELAARCLQGILQSDVHGQYNYDVAAEMAIIQAETLFRKLDEKREIHNASQRERLDS